MPPLMSPCRHAADIVALFSLIFLLLFRRFSPLLIAVIFAADITYAIAGAAFTPCLCHAAGEEERAAMPDMIAFSRYYLPCFFFHTPLPLRLLCHFAMALYDMPPADVYAMMLRFTRRLPLYMPYTPPC